MSLSSVVNKVVYTGSGITGPYTFSFPIFAASDLVVTRFTISDGTETTFVLNTDYTVSGSFTATSPADGSITLTSSLSSSYKLIIQRVLSYTQPVDLQPNDDLPADTIEKSIADRIVMLVQQVKEATERAILRDVSQTTVINFPFLENGKYLTTDGTNLSWAALVQTTTNYTGSIAKGADASKAASPAVGDIYYATDTAKIYVCWMAASWTEVYPTVLGSSLSTLSGTLSGAGRIPRANAPLVLSSIVTTLTDAATIATDASLGDYFRVTLAGNRTLGNPTNAVNGQRFVFELIQDGTGSRTLTLDTKFALGTDISAVTLSTTASKRDFLGCVYNSTADKFYVVAFSKGY